MPNLNFRVESPLTVGDTFNKMTKKFFSTMKEKYGKDISNLKEKWKENTNEFSFSAMGIPISGTIKVEFSEIEFDATIPFKAVPFKGKIQTMIKELVADVLR